MKRYWTPMVSALLMCLLLAGPASAREVARVSYQQGNALVGSGEKGPWHPLAEGARVREGQAVKTLAHGIVELTLPDRSIVRLAPETVYRIDKALFTQEKKRRKWSAKLILGRMWSKINRSVGGLRANFDTETPTAVVGVRGTVFNVDAAADTSTEVSVFEGRVGVEPPLVAPGAERKEMAWPTQVSEKQWEEIIVTKLQRLRIGADGKPGTPRAFDPAAEKDPWVDWNRQRDAATDAGGQ